MEILQTIWNVLISESSMLTNIIVSPLTFVEVYLYMLLFTTILRISKTPKQQILFVSIYSIIAIICLIFVPSPYYTIINLLALPLLVFIIFKTNILKAILSEIIIYTVTFIIGTLLIVICLYCFNLPTDHVQSIPIYRLLHCIAFQLCMYLSYITFSKFKFKFFRQKLSLRTSNYVIINFVIRNYSNCYTMFFRIFIY